MTSLFSKFTLLFPLKGNLKNLQKKSKMKYQCHGRVSGSEEKREFALRHTEIHSAYSAFDEGLLVALFIGEREL